MKLTFKVDLAMLVSMASDSKWFLNIWGLNNKVILMRLMSRIPLTPSFYHNFYITLNNTKKMPLVSESTMVVEGKRERNVKMASFFFSLKASLKFLSRFLCIWGWFTSTKCDALKIQCSKTFFLDMRTNQFMRFRRWSNDSGLERLKEFS